MSRIIFFAVLAGLLLKVKYSPILRLGEIPGIYIYIVLQNIIQVLTDSIQALKITVCNKTKPIAFLFHWIPWAINLENENGADLD